MVQETEENTGNTVTEVAAVDGVEGVATMGVEDIAAAVDSNISPCQMQHRQGLTAKGRHR